MLEAGWGGGVVSSCLRDVVASSRSIIGGGDPAGAGSSGGGVEEERFGNSDTGQIVAERRMTVPTLERNVFLGGGVVDIASRKSTDVLQEKIGNEGKSKKFT